MQAPCLHGFPITDRWCMPNYCTAATSVHSYLSRILWREYWSPAPAAPRRRRQFVGAATDF